MLHIPLRQNEVDQIVARLSMPPSPSTRGHCHGKSGLLKGLHANNLITCRNGLLDIFMIYCKINMISLYQQDKCQMYRTYTWCICNTLHRSAQEINNNNYLITQHLNHLYTWRGVLQDVYCITILCHVHKAVAAILWGTKTCCHNLSPYVSLRYTLLTRNWNVLLGQICSFLFRLANKI